MNEFEDASQKWDSEQFSEALDIFNYLAETGDISAMERLAVIYSDGCSTEYDIDKSIHWDMKAIEMGSLLSLSNLAITYRTCGDIRNSKFWFKKAVDAGDGDAALELAKLYMVSEKETEIICSLLKKAISSNDICQDSYEEANRLLKEFNP